MPTDETVTSENMENRSEEIGIRVASNRFRSSRTAHHATAT